MSIDDHMIIFLLGFLAGDVNNDVPLL